MLMFSTSALALRPFNVMNNCVACAGFMLETGVCIGVLFKKTTRNSKFSRFEFAMECVTFL